MARTKSKTLFYYIIYFIRSLILGGSIGGDIIDSKFIKKILIKRTDHLKAHVVYNLITHTLEDTLPKDYEKHFYQEPDMDDYKLKIYRARLECAVFYLRCLNYYILNKNIDIDQKTLYSLIESETNQRYARYIIEYGYYQLGRELPEDFNYHIKTIEINEDSEYSSESYLDETPRVPGNI